MPFQSMPYAPRTMYEPRYNDSIAMLMARQGEIAGQAQMRKAELWGNAMNNIGQIGAQAYQQHTEQKQAKNREMALNEVLGGWDGQDPQKLFMGLASVIGPESAVKVAQGIVAVRASKPNEPDPKLFGAKVGALKALKDKMGPDWLPSNWGSIGPMVAEDARAFLGVDLAGEYKPEYAQALDALAEQMNPGADADGQVVETVDANGKPVKRFASPDELRQGVPVYEKPAASTGNPEPVTINGKATMATPEEIAQAKASGATVTPYQAPSQRGPGEKFWVVRDGKPIRIADAEYRPGDLPASTREQGRSVTSGDAGRIADYDTSLDDLNTLAATLSSSDATGARAKAGAMLPNAVTEFTGWGRDAKTKQATIDRVKQVIGKALEGGVLRKEDEYKYEKILPTISDDATVVQEKLLGLWDAITKRRLTALDALEDANYDTAKYRARAPRERTWGKDKAADGPAPAVGERRRFGAKIGVWDGKGWKAE
jgi:hypothetical protein